MPDSSPVVLPCAHCGEMFTRRHSSQVYCSREHQLRHRTARNGGWRDALPVKSCAHCGDEFKPDRFTQRFCSRTCSVRQYELPDGAPMSGRCPVCDKEFAQSKRHRYCSPACRYRASQERNAARRVVKNCKSCQKYVPRSEFTLAVNRCNSCVALHRIGFRRCSDCQEVKSLNDFHRHASDFLGTGTRCKPCISRAVQLRQADPAARRVDRSKRLRRTFGITIEQFESMLEQQGGGCALCGEMPEDAPMNVDHDHACCPGRVTCGRCVRGILCNPCNNALGLLRDSPARALAAAAYLQRHARETA